MTIFTETTFRRPPQGGTYADATGPFAGAAMQPYTMLGAPASPSNSLADDLLTRLAGRHGAGAQEGSGFWGITSADVEAAGAGMFAAKGDRVGRQTPDEMVAQAFGDDLPQEEQATLTRQAQAASTAQQVELRTNIGLAEVHAPGAIARTGAYAGKMPGRDAFRIAYGLDEGDKRFQDFDWRAEVGRQAFGMRTMPNQAIHSALRDIDSGPNGSQGDQACREATAIAARLVLDRRRADSGGYVSELSPEISAGWKAVLGNGPTDPEAYDQDVYDRTLALSVATQKALGIDDENLQPVPFSILLKLADDRDSGSMYLMDNYAKTSALFARTKDPVARAALVRELDDAGLGGILPGGKPRLSVGEVFQADAKALGKVAANAGIFAGKLMKGVGYGISLGSIDPPDFSHGYYEPSDNVEKVMMRQGSDALGWAIPVPGFGRAVEKTIPRAIESVGFGAAGRAEGPIATRPFESAKVADTLVPEAASSQTPVEKLDSGKPAQVLPDAEERSADMALTPMNVPAKQKRPFDWDYPAIPDYDPKTGKLSTDTAGDPLTARFVAGRRMNKGADKGLTFEQLKALAGKLGIPEIEIKTLSEMREIAKKPNAFPAGGVGINKETGNMRIVIREDLSDREKLVTLSHEVSHGIYNRIKKLLNFEKIEPELRRNYQEMRAGRDGADASKSPESAGYANDKVEEELVVDGIAAALVDPNYGKTIEPKFYAALQKALKDDPFLRQLLQLNSLIATAGGASLLSGTADKSGAAKVER